MMTRDSPLVARVRYHAARVHAWWRRATVTGMAVRGVVLSTGAAALLVAAVPVLSPGPTLVAALLVAALATGWPGSFWVTGLEMATVVLATLAVAQEALPLPMVALVAALLYLHHTFAALAAGVRTDALLQISVVRRWLLHAGTVLTLSAVVGGVVVVLAAVEVGWPATAYLGLGLVAVVVVAGALAYLVRRADPT